MRERSVNFEAEPAPLEELQPRMVQDHWSLLGGKVWAIVLCVLAVLVLLVDTFGLPALKSILSSPPSHFLDLCTLDARGMHEIASTAGGFAIALFGLTALTLAGLRLAAPSSAWLSWIFLGVIAIALQGYLAYVGGIQGVLGKQISVFGLFEFELYSNVLEVQRSCIAAPTWEQSIHARYNALTARQVSLAIPYEFTNNLLLNLFCLAVYAMVAWVAAFVMTLVRLLKRVRAPRKNPIDRSQIGGWYQMNLSERAIVVQGGILTLIVLMAGPALLVLFSPNPYDMAKQVSNVLWVGPLMFLVDLARLAFFHKPDAEAVDLPSEAVPDLERPRVLAPLAKRLADEFPKQVIANAMIRQLPGKDSEAQAKSVWQVPGQGHGQLHLVGLTEAHFDHFNAYLNEGVFNRGRTALVICPPEALDDVCGNLTRRFEAVIGENVVQWHRFGDHLPDEADSLDVVFVSPESLAAMLSDPSGFEIFLQLLGGLVVLNLHHMDLGLLHVNMARLKQVISTNPDEMTAVFQSEYRNGLDEWVTNLPLMKKVKIKSETAGGLKNQYDHTILVARDAPAHGGPAELAPISLAGRLLLTAAYREPRALAYLFDREGRFVPAIWENQVSQTIDVLDDRKWQDIAKTVRHPNLLPVAHEHPIAIIHDRCNLMDAIELMIADRDADEAMRIVLQSDYALAGYHAAVLNGRLSGATSDQDRRIVLRRLLAELGPIAPDPTGGPIELAIMIREEFLKRSNNRLFSQRPGQDDPFLGEEKLRQRTLEEIWREYPAAETSLRQLQISNTKAGLEKLFRIALQPEDTSEMLSAEREADRTYSFMLRPAARNKTNTLATLRLSVDEKGKASGTDVFEQRAVRVLRSDAGLSFAQETRMAIAGRMYEVQSVYPDREELSVKYRESTTDKQFVFVRDYALLGTDEDSFGLAAEQYVDPQATKIPYEIAAGYVQAARHTRATYEFAGPTTLWTDSNTPPTRTSATVHSDLQLRSAAILRLFDGSQQPTGARRRLSRTALRGSAPQTGLIAFTLATTLQDVLVSCFPANAHRIAILAPRAALDSKLLAADPRCTFAAERLPRLVAMPENRRVASHGHGAEVGLDGPTLAQVIATADRFFELARSTTNAKTIEYPVLNEFILLEDSDHDLGVAKAFADKATFHSILKRWEGFLDYCVDQSKSAGFFYRFGGKDLPACYDFAGARDVVRSMGG